MRRFHHRFVSSLVIVAALSLFLASGAFAQAPGPFNVRSYGATGATNCSADTTGVTAALAAAAAAGGGELYFPAGTYCLTTTLLVLDYSVAFRGDGKNLSIIRWDGGPDGISFATWSTPHKTLTVKSLSLISNMAPATNAAIRGNWASSATADGPTASITDVHISHVSPGSTQHGWMRGIYLSNGTRSVITNFDIDNSSPDFGTFTAAIRLDGQTLQSTITSGSITFWQDGIQVAGSTEGLHVTDVEIVAIRRGIVLDTENQSPGTSIANNHINASEKGIYASQRNDISVSGNLIYSTPDAGSFMGIHLLNCNAFRITGNYVVKLGSGGNNGIVLEGNSTRNVISNNVTEGMHTGIWLASAGVSATNVVGNINRNYIVAPILDWGSPGANQLAANF